MCGATYKAEALFVCEQCLGPLEVMYDYDAIREAVTPDAIAARPGNLWRYRELLPIADEPRTGFHSGFTPLVRADRLARRLGVSELYIKDDSVNHPTFSYKDRVVSVAATRAVELGFTVFACASTGNLANSVSAHAARLGLDCYVFIPDNLEAAKVLGSAVYRPHVIAVAGNYDDVNRLCTQVADRYGWGFANINLRTYYAEGAKTYGLEIAEQLGWRFPRHVVSPVAGGTLLPRIGRAFEELQVLGWVDGPLPRIHAVQAAGSAPVIQALEAGAEFPDPVKPQTIAKSIAIGNPADGYHVLQTVRATGGSGAKVADEEILAAIQLLAENEGVFTEPAGGATLAGAIALIESGAIPRDESIVVCITGNGYKTSDVLLGRMPESARIGRGFADFERYLAAQPSHAPAV
jgi:threonine synthase